MGWGCEGISRSMLVTLGLKSLQGPCLYQLIQEQKIMWVNFVFFTWGWNGNSKKLFGGLGGTNTTLDMSSMAQEWEFPASWFYRYWLKWHERDRYRALMAVGTRGRWGTSKLRHRRGAEILWGHDGCHWITIFFSHSLFPTMPRHNYWKVAPLVKSLCAKHGIEYQCKPLLTAFADIVQYVSTYRIP